MSKGRISVTESRCRGNDCCAGDAFIVEDPCPPICHERWNAMYPMVYALLDGALLDCGEARSAAFDINTPTAAASASTASESENKFNQIPRRIPCAFYTYPTCTSERSCSTCR